MQASIRILTREDLEAAEAIKLKFAVLCDFASVTNDDKLNLLGIFVRLRPRQFPFITQLFVVCVFEAPSSSMDGRLVSFGVTLVDPDGEQMIVVSDNKELHSPGGASPSDLLAVNFVTGFGGLSFPRPGKYHFQVRVNGVQAGEVPLDVLPLAEEATK